MSGKGFRQGPQALSSKGLKGGSSMLRSTGRQGLMMQRRVTKNSGSSLKLQKKAPSAGLKASSNLMEAQTEMQRVQNDILILIKQQEDTQAEVNRLKEAKVKSSAELAAVEAQAQQLAAENSHHRVEIEKHNLKLENDRKVLAVTSQDVDKGKADVKKLNKKLSMLMFIKCAIRTQHKLVKARIDRNKERFEAFQQITAARQAKNQELLIESTALDTELERVEAMLQQELDEARQLADKEAALERAVADQTAEAEQIGRDHQKEIERGQVLDRTMAELQEQHKLQIEALDAKIEADKAAVADSKLELDRLHNDIKAKMDVLHTHCEDIIVLQEELGVRPSPPPTASMSLPFIPVDELKAKLDQEAESTTKELDRMKASNDDIACLEVEVATLSAEEEALGNEAQAKREYYESTRDNLEARREMATKTIQDVVSLRGKLAEMEATIESRRQEQAEAAKEAKDLAKRLAVQIDQIKLDIKDKKKEVDQVQQDIVDAREDLARHQEAAQDQLAKQDPEILKLLKEKESVEKKIMELHKYDLDKYVALVEAAKEYKSDVLTTPIEVYKRKTQEYERKINGLKHVVLPKYKLASIHQSALEVFKQHPFFQDWTEKLKKRWAVTVMTRAEFDSQKKADREELARIESARSDEKLRKELTRSKHRERMKQSNNRRAKSSVAAKELDRSSRKLFDGPVSDDYKSDQAVASGTLPTAEKKVTWSTNAKSDAVKTIHGDVPERRRRKSKLDLSDVSRNLMSDTDNVDVPEEEVVLDLDHDEKVVKPSAAAKLSVAKKSSSSTKSTKPESILKKSKKESKRGVDSNGRPEKKDKRKRDAECAKRARRSKDERHKPSSSGASNKQRSKDKSMRSKKSFHQDTAWTMEASGGVSDGDAAPAKPRKPSTTHKSTKGSKSSSADLQDKLKPSSTFKPLVLKRGHAEQTAGISSGEKGKRRRKEAPKKKHATSMDDGAFSFGH